MTQEQIEQLLKPRYKIIERWPDMGDRKYFVGEIIALDQRDGEQNYAKRGIENLYDAYFDGYPHLFKKLEWWEERKESELPKYVRFQTPKGEKVSKARFDLNETSAYFMYLDDKVFQFSPKNCLPATEQDYYNYINPQS